MFEDTRGRVATTDADLSLHRQDELREMRCRFRKIHKCSYCTTFYSLSHSLGCLTCANGDDHYAFDTEDYSSYKSYKLDYDLLVCLSGEELVPNWIQASLSTDVTAPNDQLQLVYESELDPCPKQVIIQRVFKPRGDTG